MDHHSGTPTAPQEGSQPLQGPLTAAPPPDRQPPQHPGNAAEHEKFPDLCLLTDTAAAHSSSTDAQNPTQHLHRLSTSSNLTPTHTHDASPSSRALRTASIISSAPSDFSVSVSDTSTRATTPTLDDASQRCSPDLPSAPTFGSPSPALPRSRRAKKELNAARVQRSATQRADSPAKEREATPGKRRRFLSSATGQADALAAVEPAHEQGLARMAFAEQQRWITVQQKTFTKWCAPNGSGSMVCADCANGGSFLGTQGKYEARREDTGSSGPGSRPQ